MPVTRTHIEPISLGEIAQDEPIQVALVVSRYNDWITTPMRDGAIAALERRLNGAAGEVSIIEAPGAFELPFLASEAAQSELFHAIVAIGCVIKGETTHDQHINAAVSQALARIAVESSMPIGFGVLTVESAEQAEARAGGAMGNKGAEAMDAALDALAMKEALAAVQDDEDDEEPA